MKTLNSFILLIGIMLLFVACSSQTQEFGFGSSDCNEVQSKCMKQCTKNGKSVVQCNDECERAKGMCNAIKVKGCMQECNTKYGKDTPGAESCKKACQDN